MNRKHLHKMWREFWAMDLEEKTIVFIFLVGLVFLSYCFIRGVGVLFL